MLTEKIGKLHPVFAQNRGLDSTYCPSEVARYCFPKTWRSHMNLVRQVAVDLVKENLLVVMQKGKTIMQKAVDARGAIRLRKI